MASYGKTTSAQGGTMGGTLGGMYSGYGKPADRSGLKGMGSKEVAKGMAAKAASASIKGNYPSTGKQGRVHTSNSATQSAREPDARRFGR